MLCKKPFNNFPCGRCTPCLTSKRKEWTHRLLLEGLQHEEKCFVTLTYNDKSVPQGGTLVKEDVQKFLKRLRTNTGKKIRYYAAGEYGGENQRPHYHLIIFGMRCTNFHPERPVKARLRCDCETCTAIRYAWNQRHENLKDKDSRRWAVGNVDVTEFNRLTAQYVAGYVTKKLHSTKLEGREKEFSLMSRRPGIGAEAVKLVANELNGTSTKEYNGDVPSYLRHSGQVLPLGKYLKEKLRAHFGIGKKTQVLRKKVYSNGEYTRIEKGPDGRFIPLEQRIAHKLTGVVTEKRTVYRQPSATLEETHRKILDAEEKYLQECFKRGIKRKDAWAHKEARRQSKIKKIENQNHVIKKEMEK